MSYASMAAMVTAAEPGSVWRMRLRMCAAEQLALAGVRTEPDYWVATHLERLAIQPGWGAKWDSALAGNIADPGADPAVVTDGDLLSAVQALIAADKTASAADQAAEAKAEKDKQAAAGAAEDARQAKMRTYQAAELTQRQQILHPAETPVTPPRGKATT